MKNKQNIGFLAAVDSCTFRLAVIPFTSRKYSSYEKAVVQLCESKAFEVVEVLQSDRESATFSQKFRDFIREKYGISIHYLSKASLASNVASLSTYCFPPAGFKKFLCRTKHKTRERGAFDGSGSSVSLHQ